MKKARARSVAVRVAGWTLAAVGAGVAGWRVFVLRQGDSEVAYVLPELSGLTATGGVVRGSVSLVNRGRPMAAVRRVEGRIIDGPPGRVLVTREGSRPHEPGFWVSNLLDPGESCVANVEIVLDRAAAGPLVIELDVHEIGRRPLVHRRAPFTVPAALSQHEPVAGSAARIT